MVPILIVSYLTSLRQSFLNYNRSLLLYIDKHLCTKISDSLKKPLILPYNYVISLWHSNPMTVFNNFYLLHKGGNTRHSDRIIYHLQYTFDLTHHWSKQIGSLCSVSSATFQSSFLCQHYTTQSSCPSHYAILNVLRPVENDPIYILRHIVNPPWLEQTPLITYDRKTLLLWPSV